MKKPLILRSLLLVFSFVFIMMSVQAQETAEKQTSDKPSNGEWFFTSLEEAKAVAERTGKPLFIYLHKGGCGNCTFTWKGIESDKALKKRLKKEVTFVSISTDDKNNPDFGNAYFMLKKKGGSFTTPMMGGVDAGKKVFVYEGYASAEKLNKLLNKF